MLKIEFEETPFISFGTKSSLTVNNDENRISDNAACGSVISKVFIGKSEKEKGETGSYYDGNSILVEFNNDHESDIWKYVFIGSEIFSFESKKITKFVSNIGNNDVPYPYAIDVDNNYYLMLDYVIIDDRIEEYTYKTIDNFTYVMDVYNYYYDLNISRYKSFPVNIIEKHYKL